MGFLIALVLGGIAAILGSGFTTYFAFKRLKKNKSVYIKWIGTIVVFALTFGVIFCATAAVVVNQIGFGR